MEWATLHWVHWWNTTRPHSEPGYHTPQEIEDHYRATQSSTLTPTTQEPNPGRFKLLIPGWGHYRTARVARALVLAWPVMTLVLQAKGLSFAQIGLLNSFGAVVALCAEVPAGMLADRCGHRHSLVVSNVLLALGMLVLALAGSYWGILVSELLLSVGLAAGTGSDSALLFRMHQQAGKTERYAQSLAAIRQLLVLVALVPALVAPALFAWGAALPVYVSVPLYCLAAYCFAGITVSARVAVAPHVADTQPAAGDADAADSRWARLARRGRELVVRQRRFLAIAVLAMLAGIAVSNYGQFVNPFLVSLGFQTQYLGVVLVVGTACAWLGNWLAPRLLAWQRAAGALVPLCVASIGLVVALNAVPFRWGGAVVLYGALRLLASVLGVVVDVKINKLATDTNRATLLSVTAMFDDFATIVCDPLVGIGLDALGFRPLYGLLGVLLLAAAALYFLAAYAWRAGRGGTPPDLI